MLVKIRQLTTIILALTLVLSFAGCSVSKVTPSEETPVVQEATFYNLLPFPESPNQAAVPLNRGLIDKALVKYGQNSDSVGWLMVPNTTIDDVVLFYPDNNDKFHYIRRGFDGRYSQDGSYFIDYRSEFDGTRNHLSQNTIIYGHSMNDDPNSPLFSQLKKYTEEDFARDNPYIYFSSLQEDMVWEIFSVFTTKIDFIYNRPDSTPEEFAKTLEESRSRSFYDYDVEVTPEDHILTLSTCIYTVDGVYHAYPNNYRYVIMAKLVPAGEDGKVLAQFDINNDRVKP